MRAEPVNPASLLASGLLRVEDAGRIPYAPGYDLQCARRDEVLEARGRADAPVGWLLLLEHDPAVITISRRPDARAHLVATDKMLAEAGVEVAQTDRGGDITYHGPGQLVVYPILDLNRVGLNLHSYMRTLEDIVIGLCRGLGVDAHRDVCATGVWVGGDEAGRESVPGACAGGGAKICAMGVRVRRWVTMHGLALNVATNLSHFDLIVPCGLAGRTVTSLERELGAQRCPSMDEVKRRMVAAFDGALSGLVQGA